MSGTQPIRGKITGALKMFNRIDEWPIQCYLLMIGVVLATKEYQKVMFVTKCTFGYFCGFVATIIWLPFSLSRPFNLNNISLIKEVGCFIGMVLGVKLVIRGADNLKKDRSGIIVSNHQTTLDLFVVCEVLKLTKKIVLIMKTELLIFFTFALNMWLSGSIFIKRKDRAHCYKGIHAAIEIAKRNSGCKVWFYPEGTRNQSCNDTKTLLPFKKGAFYSAITGQLPIFPIVVSLQYFADPKRWLFGGGTIYIEILPPIETFGLRPSDHDIDELKIKVQKLMQRTFDRLTLEVRETHLEEFIRYTKCVK